MGATSRRRLGTGSAGVAEPSVGASAGSGPLRPEWPESEASSPAAALEASKQGATGPAADKQPQVASVSPDDVARWFG
jgi:hypothetical protein